MSYEVTIKFKHINHARNWVAKWRPYANGGADTLCDILDQVEASFPRDPRVGDIVNIKQSSGSYLYGDVVLTDITPTHWVIVARSNRYNLDAIGTAIPRNGGKFTIEVAR